MEKKNKKKISDGIKVKKEKNGVSYSSFSSKDINIQASEYNDFSESFSLQENHKSRVLRKKYQFMVNIKKIFFLSVYVVILFFIFSFLEKTSIFITPRVEKVYIKENINLYKNPKYGQLGFDMIAISESRTKSISPNEEKEVNKKAFGEVTVFNDYSTEPQRLLPETRFQSASGKIFKTEDKWVEIPGKIGDEPGKKNITIYAEEFGKDYNLDVTDFTIPGFKEAGLLDKYNKIYAVSLKKFSGGFNGKQLVVSEDLKKDTLDKLEVELKDILSKKLLVSKTDRVILVENTPQIFFDKPIYIEEENGYVNLTQNAKLFALVIEKNKLKTFLKSTYLSHIDKESIKSIDESNDVTITYLGGNIDFNSLKKIKVFFEINKKFVWIIHPDKIIESLNGLSKKDVISVLYNFQGIQKAKIKIFPFWKKNISEDIKKINLKIID